MAENAQENNVQNVENTTNEQTQTQTQATETQTTETTETKEVKEIPDEKLDKILEKKIPGLIKSILKDNGMQDDEIKEYINSRNQRKVENSKKITDEMEALKKENAELKTNAFKNEVETSIKGLSSKLGFDEKYSKQISKLADLSDIKNEDGKVSEEKLTGAINKVLEECEAFKVTKQNETKNINGFTVVGVGQNETEENTLLQKVGAAIHGRR